MMTYLDLTNALILELGANGGKPVASVTANDNTKETARLAAFVADADYAIQARYNNWRFMWKQYNGTINSPNDQLVMPSRNVDGYVFQMFDRSSLCLFPGTSQNTFPEYQSWEDFRMSWQRGVKTLTSAPEFWSYDPWRRAFLSGQVATSPTPYIIEGWAMPYRLRSDGETSPIVRFLSTNPLGIQISAQNAIEGTGPVVKPYAAGSAQNIRDMAGRIIITRAKMIYAEAEGAQEIMQGAMAEYQECLMQLQSVAMPGQEDDWASQASSDQQIDPFPGG